MEVTFEGGLKAYITKLHLFEHPINNIRSSLVRAKYFKGAEVACRCLSRDWTKSQDAQSGNFKSKHTISMTAKPSLVNDIDGMNPITISRWDRLYRDQVSTGIVCAINDMMGYIVLHFYNQIQGMFKVVACDIAFRVKVS